MSNTIKIGDLITLREAKDLTSHVSKRPSTHNIHESVMDWLDKNPKVLARFEAKGVLPEYGAYLFEYYLQLK